MFQFSSDVFGGLPYPEFSHLLFACFPLLVLIVCVHVVSGDSGGPGILGVGLGAASALLRSALSGISSLFTQGPLGCFRALGQKPALLLLMAPIVSFCCFRLLPLLLRSGAVGAADMCLSGSLAFAPLRLEGPPKGSAAAVAAATISALWQDPDLLRLLLHAFYCSSSSAIVWLLVAPLVLFSAALLLQQAKQQQQRRPGVEQPSYCLASFMLQLLVLLPVLSGLLLVLFLSLSDYEDVCVYGFLPLLLALNFLVFAADPVRLFLLLFLLRVPLAFPCFRKMDVGVGAESWGHLASVRWFLSCVCFAFFAFEPAIFDVYLLVSAAAAAFMIAAASRCPRPFALAAAAAGAAATIAAPRKDIVIAEVIRIPAGVSPAGVILGAFAAAAAAGLIYSLQDILLAVVATRRRPEGLWRLVAVAAGLSLCFLWLPFSLKSTPRSFYEFFVSQRPALYSILLTQQDVALGAFAAKLCAFWLPFYVFAPHPHLKRVLAIAIATSVLVAMASNNWGSIGPGFLGSIICLYFFIRI